MNIIAPSILRFSIRALGIGTILFGVAPIVAPRRFAHTFGLPAEGTASHVAIRSVGVRDMVIGAGLLESASRPEENARWLLARAASDAGDAISCLVALLNDRRNTRLWLLAGVAGGAAVVDAALALLTAPLDSKR